MHLDFTDEEKLALTALLSHVIDSDRYPLSPRARTLKGILEKLKPLPVRKPLPPSKVYAPKARSKGRTGRPANQ
jgi:hypothetical protein